MCQLCASGGDIRLLYVHLLAVRLGRRELCLGSLHLIFERFHVRLRSTIVGLGRIAVLRGNRPAIKEALVAFVGDFVERKRGPRLFQLCVSGRQGGFRLLHRSGGLLVVHRQRRVRLQ